MFGSKQTLDTCIGLSKQNYRDKMFQRLDSSRQISRDSPNEALWRQMCTGEFFTQTKTQLKQSSFEQKSLNHCYVRTCISVVRG